MSTEAARIDEESRLTLCALATRSGTLWLLDDVHVVGDPPAVPGEADLGSLGLIVDSDGRRGHISVVARYRMMKRGLLSSRSREREMKDLHRTWAGGSKSRCV